MRQFGGVEENFFLRLRRVASALALAAVLSWGAAASVAAAADLMPLKAPPEPPPVSDVHGFIDVTFLNDYITPRGLLGHQPGLARRVAPGPNFTPQKKK